MLGVKVHVKGEIPEGTFVYISNHRNYIDPSVILKHIIAMPVAKAEVSKWPVIGYGTKVTGVLFVERDSKESRGNTLKGMLKCMQSGLPVLIFPEGTTHDQKQCIEFRRGAFDMAADNGFPVLPMALDYGKKEDAWIGADTFVPHFFRCFAKPRTNAYLHFGTPIVSNNRDELIAKCEAFINKELAEMPAWT
jgi:1-acyl-sn-glycerol-3-phosphate acyltransferase